MKCEKCGAEMTYFHKDSSCGYECPNCGWGLATTYIDPINEDTALYELCVEASETPTINAIKALSHAIGVGFVLAKEMLRKGGTVKKGKASDIISFVKILKEGDIIYHIVPEFPYTI